MNDRVKASVFYLLMVVLTWAAVELVAIAAIGIKDGRFFSPSAVKSQAEAVLTGPGAPQQPTAGARGPMSTHPAAEVIHPYVGVVLDPERDPLAQVSPLGFQSGDSSDEIWRESDTLIVDTLIVGLFGGSFASGVHQQSERIGSERIARELGVADQEVVVVNFSKGGYKQPQQLMILTYLLSLGARFDIVINVDGFNEVTLPPVENVPQGLNPFYPRKWNLRAGETLDPETVRNVGHMEYLKGERRRWASQLLEYGLHRSALLSLVWRVVDQRRSSTILAAREVIDRSAAGRTEFKLVKKSLACLRRSGVSEELLGSLRSLQGKPFSQREELQQALAKVLGPDRAAEHQKALARCVAKSSTSFTALGPDHPVANDDELYRDLVGMWERSSVAMKALCDAHGIRYYHFLQPNQYVEGSKPMGAEERRIAINEAQTMRPSAIAGYPPLRAAGQRLIDRGVAFTDLTMIFEDDTRVLYADDCCHLNWAGYGTVVKKILAVIAADG